MSGSKLDQIVKGAPPPGTSVPAVVSRSPSPPFPSTSPSEALGTLQSVQTPQQQPSDPFASLPSSPPQIYLNLLIVEASLRAQYLTLRARRRQHTFFLLLLTIWIAGFCYLLFLRPREDGSGVGGSVYWVVEMAEKVALMGGIVTVMLMWGTGQWERGVRWPRRWVGVANRGLRSMNAKLVVIKGAWWKELFGHLSFLFPYSSFFPPGGQSYHVETLSEKNGFDDAENASYEEDLSPGGDYIKLLLLPKPFSPDFRENWELYRSDYWEKENERRAKLRHTLRRRERELARKEGGWFWWLGRSKHPKRAEPVIKVEMDKSRHHKQHGEKEGKQRHAHGRSDSHVRNASRSSTPSALEPDEKGITTRSRRGSANSSASERRRNKKQPASIENSHITKMTPVSRPA